MSEKCLATEDNYIIYFNNNTTKVNGVFLLINSVFKRETSNKNPKQTCQFLKEESFG